MKKIRLFFVSLFVLLLVFATSVFADSAERDYLFELTVNGNAEVAAQQGDVITLSLRLKRTDADEEAIMYAMQDELTYDGTFFEIVPNSSVTAPGVQTTDLELRDGYRAFYMNFLSLSADDVWQADTLVGTVQMKVIGTSGSSCIENRNVAVSTPDGSESYTTHVSDLTVTLTDDCLVKFDSNGGSPVDDVTVKRGERLPKPADPSRDGFSFNGWFKERDLENPWTFEEDTVQGNLTLYASWEPITSESDPAQSNDGDRSSSPWLIYLIIGLIVLLLLILFLFFKRRKDDDEETPQP